MIRTFLLYSFLFISFVNAGDQQSYNQGKTWGKNDFKGLSPSSLSNDIGNAENFTKDGQNYLKKPDQLKTTQGKIKRDKTLKEVSTSFDANIAHQKAPDFQDIDTLTNLADASFSKAGKVLENGKGSEAPFCVGGDCDKHTFKSNDEFANAVAKLSILREMQDEYSAQNPYVFTGKRYECRKEVLGFRSCCGKGKGWGKAFGAKCSQDEKALAGYREEKRCAHVGTYCAKRRFGKCLKKKTAYCCYSSSLIRSVQEQAHQQLGLKWGNPKKLVCKGLSIQDVQRLDFSKIDLSDVALDFSKKVSKKANFGQGMKASLDRKLSNLKTKSNQKSLGEKQKNLNGVNNEHVM